MRFRDILNKIQEYINNDIVLLNRKSKSKVKRVKKEYQLLGKVIEEYLEKEITQDMVISFINKYAKISAKFYSILDNLDDEKINQIKFILELNQELINEHNYVVVAKYLKIYTPYYEKFFTDKKYFQIKYLLYKLNYLVYKYDLQNLVYDENVGYQVFDSFVREEINELLKDKELSDSLKKVLTRYLTLNNLELSDINKAILLINLSKTCKKASDRIIKRELNKILYAKKDIQKLEININKDDEKKYGKLKKKYHNQDKSYILMIDDIIKEDNLNLTYLYIADNLAYIEEIMEILKEDISIIVIFKILFSCVKDIVANALWFREEVKINDLNYDYEIDAAVIANFNNIKKEDILKYILETNNEYLVRLALDTRYKNYYIKNILRNASISNKELFTYIEKEISIYNVLDMDIDISRKKIIIDNYLSNESILNEEKYEYLLNSYLNLEKEDLKDYILKKIIGFKDTNLIINLLLKVNKRDEVLLVLAKIYPSDLKNKVIEYIKEELKNNGKFKFLIKEEIFLLIEDEKIYSKKFIDFLDDFGAFYVEEKYDGELLVYFVSKFYMLNLNWNMIIKKASKLNKDAKQAIYTYFYLGNKKEFKLKLQDNIIVIDSKLARGIIDEDINNIIYVIAYLSDEEIISLSTSALNIFRKEYEKGFKNNIKISEILSSNRLKDIKELLVYIMINGSFNKEILKYYDNIKIFKKLIINGIIRMKDKYLIPSYILKLGKVDDSIYNNDVALKGLFIDNIENLEAKELKEYYGDLLKFIPKVNEITKNKIIRLIIKSDIKEYVDFIKVNYE